jgi:hypothetical protein
MWVVGSASAQDKAMEAAKAQNQELAEAVAAKLRASGAMKGAKISIETRDGVVDLSGTVVSPQQHDDIMKALSKVSGIKRIDSGITMAGMAPATEPMRSPYQPNMLERAGGQGEGFGGGPLPPPLGTGPAPSMNEPVPLNGMPIMAPLDPSGPRLPPNAWPTYAPHNNMSRVAYPQSYPYNAFPYIGPYYPFPKVPLGWRKVVLEWEDGHWYYGRLSSPHDTWRVKFW